MFNSGRWLANKGFEAYSPNKYYRLEFWHHPFYEGEGYVYIYNNQVNKRLAASQLFFMEGNSFTFWERDEVMIGASVVFKITPEPEKLCCSSNQPVASLSGERIILSNESMRNKAQE